MITIDIDWLKLSSGYIISSEEQFKETILAMQKCGDAEIEYRRSASGNGYHIRCKCRGCDKCRMVFDSPRRWDMDQSRSPETRDVLWNVKFYKKCNRVIRLESGEWIKLND